MKILGYILCGFLSKPQIAKNISVWYPAIWIKDNGMKHGYTFLCLFLRSDNL